VSRITVRPAIVRDVSKAGSPDSSGTSKRLRIEIVKNTPNHVTKDVGFGYPHIVGLLELSVRIVVVRSLCVNIRAHVSSIAFVKCYFQVVNIS
jgi:hypothetical protein